VSGAPSAAEIFDSAVAEGERRLDQSLLELVSTSFIAGFTVVFGVVALGIVHVAIPAESHVLGTVAGAFGFGIGLVFLVIGRAELFTENFFDPTAAAIERDDSWALGPVARLWTVTFALNLVGGALMIVVFSVEGVLPHGSAASLRSFAIEMAGRSTVAEFASAVAGGTLVTLLSFLLAAADGTGSRIALAYVVGFLLTLGPFDHVVVTVLHVLFGLAFGADIGLASLGHLTLVATVGNVVGGIGLVTLTHVAQAAGARA
jgi:formate/nitrite transporter FocA (FNT family)